MKEHRCTYMQVTTLSEFLTNINYLPIQICHLNRSLVLEERRSAGGGGYASSQENSRSIKHGRVFGALSNRGGYSSSCVRVSSLSKSCVFSTVTHTFHFSYEALSFLSTFPRGNGGVLRQDSPPGSALYSASKLVTGCIEMLVIYESVLISTCTDFLASFKS